MGKAEVLQYLTQEVRAHTLGVFTAAEESWCTWVPKGLSNHMLWHAGHAVWIQDLMCVEPLAGQSEMPAGWAPLFDMDSRPRDVQDWPARRDLRLVLEAQSSRMLELLASVSDADLAGPAASLGRSRNLMGWITHGLHDEAKHCGEMYLLLKMCRAASQ